jgi:hypothetical protein
MGSARFDGLSIESMELMFVFWVGLCCWVCFVSGTGAFRLQSL